MVQPFGTDIVLNMYELDNKPALTEYSDFTGKYN